MAMNNQILRILKENKAVVKEESVKPEFQDLGAAVVSPTQTDHPDYTKGVPGQPHRTGGSQKDHAESDDASGAREGKGKVSQDEIEKDGDGPKLKAGEKIVAEDTTDPIIESAKRFLKGFSSLKEEEDKDDKKDDEKKDDVKEDAGADAENARQTAKRADGEPMHHIGDKGTKAVSEEKDGDKDDDKKDDEKKDGDKDDKDDKKPAFLKNEEADKADMAEDVTALFAGEKLTPAFKKKATVIFEAAVNTRVAAIVARKETQMAEYFEQELGKEVETITEAMATRVDKYLNYIAEEWIKENALVVENTLKTDILENFAIGLKSLFEAHYIEVPQNRIDLVGTLAGKVEKLEEQLNSQIENNIQLSEENATFKKDAAFNSITEGLTAAQVDKLKTLSENVEFKSVDDFKQNLQILREGHFPKAAKPASAQSLTEEAEGTAPITVETKGEMNTYTKALSKLAEK